MKKLLILFLLCSALPCFASWSIVQTCTAANDTFFSTTTAVCTLPGSVSANHLLIVLGYSCRNTCQAIGTQATHAISDTLGFTYTNGLDTLFDSGSGNVSRNTMWYVETGATTGSDTVTLTLNTSAGNGILVMEVSGLATSSPVIGATSLANGFYAGSGSSPVLFSDGTITIGGIGNTAVAYGANGTVASGYTFNFMAFQAVSGQDLLLVLADCNNCGGLFGTIPAGWTRQFYSLWDNDDVVLTASAVSGSVRHRAQVY